MPRICKLPALTLVLLLLPVGCSASKNGQSPDTKGSAVDVGTATDGGTSTRKNDAGLGAVDVQIRDTSSENTATDSGHSDAPAILDSGDNKKDAGKDVVRDLAKSETTSTNDVAPSGPDGPPPAGTCASPIPIPSYISHSDIVTTTAGASHQVDMSCGANGADVVFSIFVAEPTIIYADTFGTAWDTMLQISDECPPTTSAVSWNGLESCSDDACNTTQSQVEAFVGRGTYYLVLSDADGESGPATIHVDQSTVGGGVISPFPEGTGSFTGTTHAGGRNGSLICEANGPDDTYWWTTCPDATGGAFSASTCEGTAFDTTLTLQIPRAGVVACNDDDDACGLQSTVSTTVPPGAGLQTLIVGGTIPRAYGDYTVTYTCP